MKVDDETRQDGSKETEIQIQTGKRGRKGKVANNKVATALNIPKKVLVVVSVKLLSR
jgi:hypothetical protein